MKQLLDQIIEAEYKANTFFSKRPVKPKPRRPASPVELRRLDAYLEEHGLRAPASYKEFLSVYNGIDDVLGRGYSLLSIDEVVGRKYELIEDAEDDYPDLCPFVIAAGNTPNFMSFDASTSAAREGYEVVEITAEGGECRFKSFKQFLDEWLANLQKTIRDEEKDRSNLKP